MDVAVGTIVVDGKDPIYKFAMHDTDDKFIVDCMIRPDMDPMKFVNLVAKVLCSKDKWATISGVINRYPDGSIHYMEVNEITLEEKR